MIGRGTGVAATAAPHGWLRPEGGITPPEPPVDSAAPSPVPPASGRARAGRGVVLEAALIGLLALTLNLLGNGRVSLWDRDEPRYAGCTREMRASGDWIHPTFNAEPRYHKPVLIYWLMLAGTAAGGGNPVRAPRASALWGNWSAPCPRGPGPPRPAGPRRPAAARAA